MFCTTCGKPVPPGAKFCPHCGALQTASAAEQAAQPVSSPVLQASPDTRIPPSSPEKPKVRPWIRFWARTFDIILSSILLGFAAGYFYPEEFLQLLSKPGGEMLAGLAFLFAWVFIEPILLGAFGTTPGKWLFNIRLVPPKKYGKPGIISPQTDKPDYSTALSRSFDVWWRGLGMGLPLVSLFTLLFAYKKLSKHGQTTWDQKGGFTVVHERLGVVKLLFAVIIFMGWFVLIAVSNDPALTQKVVSEVSMPSQFNANTQTSDSLTRERDPSTAKRELSDFDTEYAEFEKRRELAISNTQTKPKAAGSNHTTLIAGRYRDNNDGTVTDTQTGLQWKRCYEGQRYMSGACSGKADEYSWNNAKAKFGQGSSYADKHDWRMPSIDELLSLVYCSSGRRTSEGVCDGDYQLPMLNASAFPSGVVFWVWSGSPYAADTDSAWVVGFHNGSDRWGNKGYYFPVRLVRGQ